MKLRDRSRRSKPLLPRARLDRTLIIPAAALAGLVAWTLLSLTWTESSERTWAELSRLLGYAGFAVLAWSALNRYTFRAAAAGLSVAAVIVCVLAVASRVMLASFPVDQVSIAFDTDPRSGARYPRGWQVVDHAVGEDNWLKTVREPKSSLVFQLIPAGTFLMGSPNSEFGREALRRAEEVIASARAAAEGEDFSALTDWVDQLERTRVLFVGVLERLGARQ